MTTAALLSPRRRRLGRFATALCASLFIALGVADLVRVPMLAAEMAHLGYPAYLLTILGVAKILGGTAIFAFRGRSRVAEWAYAGMAFDLIGAALSHAAVRDDASRTAAPLGLLLLVAASWALRPEVSAELRAAAIKWSDLAWVKRLWQAPVKAVLGRVDNTRFGVTDSLYPGTAPHTATARVAPGPYYVPGSPLRSDLREDREGMKLTLRLRVIDQATQTPCPGALLDLWQCDANGLYSGFLAAGAEFPNAAHLLLDPGPSDDARFLRGRFHADGRGEVEFITIVPGWYPPRTPHIHVKVECESQTFVTQLFFPQDIIAEVQAQPPYDARPPGPVSNEHDLEIYRSKGAVGCWPAFTKTEDGLLAELTLRVPNQPAGSRVRREARAEVVSPS